MALATRCTNCQAVFRVVVDQLKLRGGLVRCGQCSQVFDAIGTLIYVDDAQIALSAGATPAPEFSLSGAPDAGETERAVERRAEVPPAVPDLNTLALFEDAPAPADARPPAPTADASVTADTDAPAAVDAADAADAADAPTAEAPPPTFLDDDEAPRARRPLSLALLAGVVLGAVALLLQLAVLFRTELVARWPAVRPALVALCTPLRCTVGWPTRPDLLAVIGSELLAIPGTAAFELTATIRNRGATTVALPAIELTLTDTQNRMVARRVFAPADYLASAGEGAQAIDAGLAAGADYTVKLVFEARGIKASGFVVYPFYL